MSSRLRRSLVLTTLLALLLGVSGAAADRASRQTRRTARVAGIDVDATTIPELQELMDADRLTSVQLTQFYLHRISKLNPTLNAVITVSPTALADARAATGAPQRRTTGRCSASRSSSRTTSTRPACRRQPAPGHSPGARPTTRSSRTKLQAAGAIIIGKANLSEWANFRSGPVVERLERHRWARRTCPTSSIATRAARAPAPASSRRLISRSRPSARRRMARSSARPAPTASSGSSRRSGCGAAQASSRSARSRTRPARWPAT